MITQIKKVTFINGSYAVFLPHAWWRIHKVDESRQVLMLWDKDKIVLKPFKEERKNVR